MSFKYLSTLFNINTIPCLAIGNAITKRIVPNNTSLHQYHIFGNGLCCRNIPNNAKRLIKLVEINATKLFGCN